LVEGFEEEEDAFLVAGALGFHGAGFLSILRGRGVGGFALELGCSVLCDRFCYSFFTPMSQNYHARIYVTLRPSVLDPAGTAVQAGLKHMGYDNVEQVRIGKYVEVKLSAVDEGAAKVQLDLMCDQLLSNPVIENYCFEVVAV
jgi:phosphoribosylformylglycinamidine synthase subunit PurS